jgi:hypothetical protein
MSDFTKKEIEAELARRRKAEVARDEARDRARAGQVDPSMMTTCLHCGQPMKIWEAGDPGNPVCDTCL